MQQCMMGNDTNFDMMMFSHQDRNNRMSLIYYKVILGSYIIIYNS